MEMEPETRPGAGPELIPEGEPEPGPAATPMSRRGKIVMATLVIAVVVAAYYSPRLYRNVTQLARPSRTEEHSRREVVQPSLATPTDVTVKAKMFWTSVEAPATLGASEIEIPLSADPVLRAKQLITALIDEPSPEQRILPEDATLLEFYLLPDGTGVADFSDSLSTEIPSGILSEQMAVDSIARTLAANDPAVHRLKILIHGQETETLAGHLDLSGYFFVAAATPAAPTPAAAPSSSPAPAAKPPAAGLTPSAAPGKLGH